MGMQERLTKGELFATGEEEYLRQFMTVVIHRSCIKQQHREGTGIHPHHSSEQTSTSRKKKQLNSFTIPAFPTHSPIDDVLPSKECLAGAKLLFYRTLFHGFRATVIPMHMSQKRARRTFESTLPQSLPPTLE
jgi:hypothetical protein